MGKGEVRVSRSKPQRITMAYNFLTPGTFEDSEEETEAPRSVLSVGTDWEKLIRGHYYLMYTDPKVPRM